MRLNPVAVATLMASLGLTCPARAGLYNEGSGLSNRPDALVPLTFNYLLFAELRAAATPIDLRGSARERYLRQKRALDDRKRDWDLTQIERADLGACCLRLGLTQEALRLLTAGDQHHFLIQANLATAYFMDGQYELALRHQRQLLESDEARGGWPAVWAGWTRDQLAWYRRGELYFLRLIQSRLEETRRPTRRGGLGRQSLPIDGLFAGVNLPAKGRYVAGGTDAQTADHLPPNSLEILLQLLFWLPADDRLYWQLGELFNAAGQVDVAAMIFNDLSNRGLASSFQDLVYHRQVVVQSLRAYRLLVRDITKPSDAPRRNCTALLSVLAPRGLPAPPGVGSIAQETAALAPFVGVTQAVVEPKEEPVPEKSVEVPWRNVTLGFVLGAVVTALIGLQLQQWRRRRAANQLAALGDEHPLSSQASQPVGDAFSKTAGDGE